jgi:uncharacterized coiled-coil DUF342 family protein
MSELKMRCRTCPIVQPAMHIISDLQFKLRNAMDSANTAQRKARRLSKLVDLYRATAKEYQEQLDSMRGMRDELLLQIEVAKNPVPSAVKGLDL